MKKTLFIIAISLFTGCQTSPKGHVVKNIFFDNCNFIKLQEPFIMEILSYSPAPEIGCGSFATISVCVGKTNNNDTIRVLTLCNTDTTFLKQQKIIITPMIKPNFYVSPPFYLQREKNGYKSYVPFGKLKTIYGEIEKL